MNLNYDYENENAIENENTHIEVIENMIRISSYLQDLYDIKDTLTNDDCLKFFGCTRDKGLKVVITQVDVDIFDIIVQERINVMIKLIEQDLVLVENFWMQESIAPKEGHPRFSLFVSEFTKEVYQREFSLYSFSVLLRKDCLDSDLELDQKLVLFKNFLNKLQILHNMNFAHLSLSTNNVFFNFKTNEVFLGPAKIAYDEMSLSWYSSPEITFNKQNNQNNFDKSNLEFEIENDIWSVGCIIAELFFTSTPIFQSYSIRDKARRLFEINGLPDYEDVRKYISKGEFKMIYKGEGEDYRQVQSMKEAKVPLIYDLINYNEKSIKPFERELQSILIKCLNFNPDKRPSVKELISGFIDLDDLSFKFRYNKSHSHDKTNISNTNRKQVTNRSSYLEGRTHKSENTYNNYNGDNTYKASSNSSSYKIYKFNEEENNKPPNNKPPTNNDTENVIQKINRLDTNKRPIKADTQSSGNDEYKYLNSKLDDLLDYLKKLESEG